MAVRRSASDTFAVAVCHAAICAAPSGQDEVVGHVLALGDKLGDERDWRDYIIRETNGKCGAVARCAPIHSHVEDQRGAGRRAELEEVRHRILRKLQQRAAQL